jgi:hypothetical protein
MSDSQQVEEIQQSRTSQNNQQEHLYPRIENLTGIKFTEEEKELLNNGLQYSIEKPLTTYFTKLVIETERAIKLLDKKLQKKYRTEAAKKLEQIFKSSNDHNIPQKEQLPIVGQLKSKLVTENAILAQADNGKTVIIDSDEYCDKVHAFLEAKTFHVFPKDPTECYKRLVGKALRQCSLIIDKQEIKYLMQKIPSPPKLKAQLKLHEHNIEIRPVINNTKAPTYKTAERLVRILKEHLTLNNYYTVANSTNLAIHLTNLKIEENHKFVTYNIKDLFDNIPIEETLKIIESILLKNNDKTKTQQIITLTKLVLSQNYLTFQNKIYKCKSGKGVPLGSPISSIIAEIFLQNFEDEHIKQLLDTKDIIFYRRYADDILIIYDNQRIQPDRINTSINKIYKDINFNQAYENNEGIISFLDLNIIRRQSNLEIDIFRKPTTTNTTINFLSNHPIEHRVAAFRYDITRMHSLPLTPERKQKEWTYIQQIAQCNKFPQEFLQDLNLQIQDNQNKQEERNEENKDKTTRTTFTYYSPIVTEITKLFQQVEISFKITNTLQQLTEPRIVNNTQEQDKSGIYKLTCNTCKMSYIGQTSRSLKQRYQEHIRDIRNNKPRLTYAKHILNNKHEHDTMTLLKHIHEPTLLTPYEQLYIQLYHDNKQLIPEQKIVKGNLMYQLTHDPHNMPLSPINTPN